MSHEMKNDYQMDVNQEGVRDTMREQAEGVNKMFQEFLGDAEMIEAKEDTEKKEEKETKEAKEATVEMRLNRGGNVSFAGGCSKKCIRCNVDSSDCKYS